ncbi:MAG: hypothetical protein R3F14_42770 [Polyangiaceae bacterium]
MSAPTAGNVVVSYRGIASLFEGIDLDERAAPGTPTRTEAGEDAIVRAAEGDPIAELGAPAQPEPAAPEDLSDIDDLQRIAMIAGLRRAIDEIARADKTPGVLFAPEDQASSLLLAYLSQQGLSSGKLAELGDGRYEVKFDDRDLTGWVGSFFRDWIKRLRKHRFLAPPAAPEVIGNTCRVALLGDWGTGLYGAPRCALSIKEAKPAFDVVVHLGDIYYAGNPGEVRERFLAHWPEVPGALSRAVNANHEMYSGGEGISGGGAAGVPGRVERVRAPE